MALQAPTFAGTALCTTSQRQVPGPIGVRVFMEHVPGVDGQFAQPQGHSGRDIMVMGILETTAKNTAALALETAYSELRTLEALADGATVGAYVDPAAGSHSNCILMSYAPIGPVQIVEDATTGFKGIWRIRAIIRELNP